MDKRWKRLAKLKRKAAAIREEISLLTEQLAQEAPPNEISVGGMTARIKRNVSYYVPAKRIPEIKKQLSPAAFRFAFATSYRFKAGSLRDPRIEETVKPEARVTFNVTFTEE